MSKVYLVLVPRPDPHTRGYLLTVESEKGEAVNRAKSVKGVVVELPVTVDKR